MAAMRQAIDRIPSSAAYIRFFVPLALQTIAQSVTHPLVAVIAAQAPGGVANVAAMAQSTSISFLLQTFNMGLVTTGMIYARSASGFRVFSRLNLILVSVLGGVHLFFALPGPGSWLFDGLIGLPPQIAGPARLGFRAGIPLACLFMFRSRYYAILFANKASGRSSISRFPPARPSWSPPTISFLPSSPARRIRRPCCPSIRFSWGW